MIPSFLLCFCKNQFITELLSNTNIKARHFHSAKGFIDDLCAINDVGKFERTYTEIYPKELEFKVEHQSTQEFFLNLNINIVD